MRRSPANSTHRSLAAFGKLQHIPWIRRLLFPKFYKPLPDGIQDKVLIRAESEGVKGTGEALFLHVRYDARITGNERLMAKLASFLGGCDTMFNSASVAQDYAR